MGNEREVEKRETRKNRVRRSTRINAEKAGSEERERSLIEGTSNRLGTSGGEGRASEGC